MSESLGVTYPVQFSVDYPDRELNRLTSFFRIFTAIPIAIVLGTIGGYSARWGTSTTGTTEVAIGGTGLLFLPTLLMLVFRQKYPRWWFDWNLQFLRFANRVGVYLALMDDRYPSTDEEQAVNLEFHDPITVDEARAALRRAPGVVLVDDLAAGHVPLALAAEGRDEVFVGRLRRDPTHERGLQMWVVSDNLLKGAATNAVQIAEALHARGLIEVRAAGSGMAAALRRIR